MSVQTSARTRARTALFFATHVCNDRVLDHWQAVRTGVPDDWTLVLFHEQGSLSEAELKRFDADLCVAHDAESWKRHKHPSRFFPDKIPCNEDANFLWGIAQLPPHDFYWLIEYDVALSGSWSEFFGAFEDCRADCLSTNLTRYAEFPAWPLWKSYEGPEDAPIPRESWVRYFAPVLRLSHRATRVANAAFEKGYAGAAEFILPTVLHANGLTLEDIGGESPFTPECRQGLWYRSTRLDRHLVPGTFVFRPTFDSPGAERNLLWHPVKMRSAADWDRRPAGSGRWKRIYWRLRRSLRRLGRMPRSRRCNDQ